VNKTAGRRANGSPGKPTTSPTSRGSATSRFRIVDPAVMAHFRPLAEAALNYVDKHLEDREWLVGDACGIADIGCWGRMVFMAEGGIDIARWPHVEAWSKRLKIMPGFALPYDLIPKRTRR